MAENLPAGLFNQADLTADIPNPNLNPTLGDRSTTGIWLPTLFVVFLLVAPTLGCAAAVKTKMVTKVELLFFAIALLTVAVTIALGLFAYQQMREHCSNTGLDTRLKVVEDWKGNVNLTGLTGLAERIVAVEAWKNTPENNGLAGRIVVLENWRNTVDYNGLYTRLDGVESRVERIAASRDASQTSALPQPVSKSLDKLSDEELLKETWKMKEQIDKMKEQIDKAFEEMPYCPGKGGGDDVSTEDWNWAGSSTSSCGSTQED